MYTEKELNDMFESGVISLFEYTNTPYYIIYTSQIKTVQVEYVERYEFYTVSVTTNDDLKVYVLL